MPSFTGTVLEHQEGKIVLKDGAGSRTIRTKNYEGELPPLGAVVRAEYRSWKPDDWPSDRKAMNFLEGWDPADAPSPQASAPSPGTPASQPSDKFTGRDPGANDWWVAARWAVSVAVEVLGAGKNVEEYLSVGKSFLVGAHDLGAEAKAEYETGNQ